jgi:hypothetical protein
MPDEKISNDEAGARIVFRAEWRAPWLKFLKKKGIGQQDTIERLILFLLDQDDLAQSAILGIDDMTDDLYALMLKRLHQKTQSAPPVVAVGSRSDMAARNMGVTIGRKAARRKMFPPE